jgi:hypothetical protein
MTHKISFTLSVCIDNAENKTPVPPYGLTKLGFFRVTVRKMKNGTV